MLNANNERELCYVVKIEEVKPLEGYDRVEYARIGAGWWVVVKKDEFKVGDLAVYFEIDSKVPAIPAFEFMEKYKYRVRTIKLCKVLSQGLIVHPKDFGLTDIKDGDFLTKRLGVIYYEPEDNTRKAPSTDHYRSMQDRHKKLFRSKFGRWMMQREWGRKVMFFLFGKKKDKKTDWPAWVKKTDEERAQNMGWLFPDNKTKWIATEKIDGTSTTFTMLNNRKKDLIVCSRNVVFNSPEKEEKNYYKDSDGNVYLEMSYKYNMKQVCENALAYWESTKTPLKYITIQGETFGGNIQKRDYGPEHRLAIFNVIFGFKNGTVQRLNPVEMSEFLTKIQPEDSPKLFHVPIVSAEFMLPSTCEELLTMATGISEIDGKEREGLVFRSQDGTQSFKAVSNEFLLKYHV